MPRPNHLHKFNKQLHLARKTSQKDNSAALFTPILETLLSIEYQLCTHNPKCKSWAYNRRGAYIGKDIRVSFQGAYTGGHRFRKLRLYRCLRIDFGE